MVKFQHPLFHSFLLVSLRKEDKKRNPSDLSPPLTIHPYTIHTFSPSTNAPSASPIFCYPDNYSVEACLDQNQRLPLCYCFALTLSDAQATTLYGFCHRILSPSAASLPPLSSSSPSFPHTLCILTHYQWPTFYFRLLRICEEIIYGANYNSAKNNLRHQPTPESLQEVDCFLAGLITQPIHSLTLAQTIRVPSDGREVSRLSVLLDCLPLPTLIFVFASMMNERRLIFSSSSLSRLSACVFAALQLLDPFKWQHITVPLLPPNLISHVCAPMPFIQGIHSSLEHLIKQLPTEEVLVIRVDDGTVAANYDPKKQDGDLRNLPRRLVGKLRLELENIMMSRDRDDVAYNVAIRKAFLSFFLSIFGKYRLYFKSHKANELQFDMDSFLADQPKDTRQFLTVFKESQMWHRWIRMREATLLKREEPEGEFEAEAMKIVQTNKQSKGMMQAMSYVNWFNEGLKLNKKKLSSSGEESKPKKVQNPHSGGAFSTPVLQAPSGSAPFSDMQQIKPSPKPVGSAAPKLQKTPSHSQPQSQLLNPSVSNIVLTPGANQGSRVVKPSPNSSASAAANIDIVVTARSVSDGDRITSVNKDTKSHLHSHSDEVAKSHEELEPTGGSLERKKSGETPFGDLINFNFPIDSAAAVQQLWNEQNPEDLKKREMMWGMFNIDNAENDSSANPLSSSNNSNAGLNNSTENNLIEAAAAVVPSELPSLIEFEDNKNIVNQNHTLNLSPGLSLPPSQPPPSISTYMLPQVPITADNNTLNKPKSDDWGGFVSSSSYFANFSQSQLPMAIPVDSNPPVNNLSENSTTEYPSTLSFPVPSSNPPLVPGSVPPASVPPSVPSPVPQSGYTKQSTLLSDSGVDFSIAEPAPTPLSSSSNTQPEAGVNNSAYLYSLPMALSPVMASSPSPPLSSSAGNHMFETSQSYSMSAGPMSKPAVSTIPSSITFHSPGVSNTATPYTASNTSSNASLTPYLIFSQQQTLPSSTYPVSKTNSKTSLISATSSSSSSSSSLSGPSIMSYYGVSATVQPQYTSGYLTNSNSSLTGSNENNGGGPMRALFPAQQQPTTFAPSQQPATTNSSTTPTPTAAPSTMTTTATSTTPSNISAAYLNFNYK